MRIDPDYVDKLEREIKELREKNAELKRLNRLYTDKMTWMGMDIPY